MRDKSTNAYEKESMNNFRIGEEMCERMSE